MNLLNNLNIWWHVWTGMPRIFLTLSAMWLTIGGMYSFNGVYNLWRFHLLDGGPWEGIDVNLYWYGRKYLRIVIWQAKMFATTFFFLAIFSALIYIGSQ